MKKIEALQASFKSTKWQRWVRQLRFSNGSLWYSSSPFSCLANLGLHLFVPCRFTPGQEVFGSSVVACLECYRESSSDGRLALPLSAVNPWKEKKGAENENRWLLMEINTSKSSSSSRIFAHPSQVKLTVQGGCGNKVELPFLMLTEAINWKNSFSYHTWTILSCGRWARAEMWAKLMIKKVKKLLFSSWETLTGSHRLP